MIPNENELRLCFDNDVDGSPDWVSPDRVVIYAVDNGQLIRSDIENNRSNVIAVLVDSIQFERVGSELQIAIDFEVGNVSDSYLFNTPAI